MSAVIRRGMQPRNAFTANLIRFVPNFRVLHVSWTHNALMSEGVEQFVEEFLPIIRSNNPQIRYTLKRTHILCDPFIVGEYTFLRTRKKRCSWRTSLQVLSMVEEMSLGGSYIPVRQRQVNTRLPRGLELWSTETIGHDVYKILSKWKADPPDPDEITSKDHPNWVFKNNAKKKT